MRCDEWRKEVDFHQETIIIVGLLVHHHHRLVDIIDQVVHHHLITGDHIVLAGAITMEAGVEVAGITDAILHHRHFLQDHHHHLRDTVEVVLGLFHPMEAEEVEAMYQVVEVDRHQYDPLINGIQGEIIHHHHHPHPIITTLLIIIAIPIWNAQEKDTGDHMSSNSK